MYALYRLGSVRHDPNALWLSYKWGDSFANSEWRPCVELFLAQVATLGYLVEALPSPPFEKGEDFVEITYLVDGVRTVFASDHLLSLIVITSENPKVIKDLWDIIGTTIGWIE